MKLFTKFRSLKLSAYICGEKMNKSLTLSIKSDITKSKKISLNHMAHWIVINPLIKLWMRLEIAEHLPDNLKNFEKEPYWCYLCYSQNGYGDKQYKTFQ